MERVFTFAGDESGDSSFKFEKGASRYFVVALVATDEPDTIRSMMQDLKITLRLPDQYEYKYHKLSSFKMKRLVFTALSQARFSAWALIVDKTSLMDSFKFLSSKDFYLYFVTELIQRIPDHDQQGATLILDEFGENPNIALSVRKFLKTRGIAIGFKRIIARDSKKEPLIQLADLIAGAVAHRDSAQGTEHTEQLLSKIEIIHEFNG
jgi:hypothetical protein